MSHRDKIDVIQMTVWTSMMTQSLIDCNVIEEWIPEDSRALFHKAGLPNKPGLFR